MGVPFDYFAAESDGVAATVLHVGPWWPERPLPFVDAERGTMDLVASAGDDGPWVERMPDSLLTPLTIG